MDNNQNELNRLVSELAIQKYKDRKHYLRIEIAKATDRTVKRALEDILADIERKERRNLVIGLVIVVLVVLFSFYLLGGKKDKPLEKVAPTETSSSIMTTSTSSSEKPPVPVIKEKNLTAAEVKEWVDAVWAKRYQNFSTKPGYELEVKVDDKDQLVYIRVKPPQGMEIDNLDYFRINAKGELEQSGYYAATGNIEEWVVVSRNFLDVSQVKSYPVPVQSITGREFAEHYVAWSNRDLPLMHATEFAEKYGEVTEADDSFVVVVYGDRNDGTAYFAEETLGRLAKFFYTYDNRQKQAYLHRNDDSNEVEFVPELTTFIHNQQ